jgi:23S rRNA pseudouridine1911/1915/1917 synthase
MRILYEDAHLLLCEKPQGMPSQPDPTGQVSLLDALREAHPTVGLVHRLDTPTGGVMLFSKMPAMTGKLSALVQEHESFVKEYLAVLPTAPDKPEAIWEDILFHDKTKNKSFAVSAPRKGAKTAKLSYRVLDIAPDGHALVLIRLYTGRTHQIRVQAASRGLPLVGDGKYGSREKAPYIALWSHRATLPHPVTGKTVVGVSLPPADVFPWSLFATAWASLGTQETR